MSFGSFQVYEEYCEGCHKIKGNVNIYKLEQCVITVKIYINSNKIFINVI